MTLKSEGRDIYFKLGKYVGDFVYEETYSKFLADLAEFGTSLGTRAGAQLLQEALQQWLKAQQPTPSNVATTQYGFLSVYQMHDATTF